MTRNVTLPRIGTAQAWRDAARDLLAQGIAPADVVWQEAGAPRGLFDDDTPGTPGGVVRVPRSFIAMADSVIWHADPSRFARLYHFLWRLREAPQLMSDRGDADLARLRGMEKGVHRCQHKMKAFVRFREIGAPEDARRSFAAWFEPTHHTVEPTAQFFRRRFADMDWRIVTPDISVLFEAGKLRFIEDQPAPDLPEDASEALWVTYYRNIFNPARLKVQAMTSEMPKKYWKYMPEAALIPELIAGAPARARAMAEAAPTLPPARMGAAQSQLRAFASTWDANEGGLAEAVRSCTRCPLHRDATQAVPGEGPPEAALMIVGEQPGDQEDLRGRPFVGPAGQMFDAVAAEVGLDRTKAFVTNAVKHFKFTPRGRQRIHQRPDTSEINHCKWWLEAEMAQVSPRLILAMGATAAQALTGSGDRLLARRGRVEERPGLPPVLITLHPSYILRLRDAGQRAEARANLAHDMALSRDLVA
ncbi:UdgX family uracil-DNA binding protein [Jannaschia pohangensis]|uniref:Type-4 uracil-DNA glycosylase n=1 Tax=Jannaschia pohangensis TaxID=390807 RepID=A0A1I3TP27_9RHOB|nr:UdgX family uracil-DNA binding protein [Jannaschia pohangensis]SFJ71381.1 DNA polymerase [Jannaschia pohangensis]